MLALVQRRVDEHARGLDAAHQLHQHIDLGIVEQCFGLISELCGFGQRHGTRLAQIAHEHLFHDNVAPGATADKIRIFRKQTGKAAAHGTKTGQSNIQRFIRFRRHHEDRCFR